MLIMRHRTRVASAAAIATAFDALLGTNPPGGSCGRGDIERPPQGLGFLSACRFRCRGVRLFESRQRSARGGSPRIENPHGPLRVRF